LTYREEADKNTPEFHMSTYNQSRGREDGLSDERRLRENRQTTIFLIGFLAFCIAAAAYSFAFYIWVIELGCVITCIAIFVFAFNIKDYTTDASSLSTGLGFLFTFAFEAAYLYAVSRSGSPDFRFAAEGCYLWVCAQWFLAFTFLTVLNRAKPRMTVVPVAIVDSAIALVLLAINFLFRDFVDLLQTRYRGAYLGINAAALGAFYVFILAKLRRSWAEQPEYFALRSLASMIGCGLGGIGVILTIDAGPVPVFSSYFLRFAGLYMAFNANVTFILLSPFRALYGQLSARAEQLSEANGRLASALAEKEVLLGEIHHRVKNNLQVVSSLLSLQSQKHDDDGFRDSIAESQDRIRAMALVHEMLYQNKDFTAIDFGEYVERILAELFSSNGRSGIRRVVDCEPVQVPIDAAITCSLIINELVTNCLKHAFPDGREGTVKVSLSASPSTVSISVEDDGIGLPEGFEIDGRKSMGLSLLTALSSQLRGSFEIRGTEGTRIIIRFPNEGPRGETPSGGGEQPIASPA
jgi:two-component sensor histidine kinase